MSRFFLAILMVALMAVSGGIILETLWEWITRRSAEDQKIEAAITVAVAVVIIVMAGWLLGF